MPMIPTDGSNQAESGFFRDIYFAIDLFYTSGGRDDSLPPSVFMVSSRCDCFLRKAVIPFSRLRGSFGWAYLKRMI